MNLSRGTSTTLRAVLTILPSTTRIGTPSCCSVVGGDARRSRGRAGSPTARSRRRTRQSAGTGGRRRCASRRAMVSTMTSARIPVCRRDSGQRRPASAIAAGSGGRRRSRYPAPGPMLRFGEIGGIDVDRRPALVEIDRHDGRRFDFIGRLHSARRQTGASAVGASSCSAAGASTACPRAAHRLAARPWRRCAAGVRSLLRSALRRGLVRGAASASSGTGPATGAGAIAAAAARSLSAWPAPRARSCGSATQRTWRPFGPRLASSTS